MAKVTMADITLTEMNCHLAGWLWSVTNFIIRCKTITLIIGIIDSFCYTHSGQTILLPPHLQNCPPPVNWYPPFKIFRLPHHSCQALGIAYYPYSWVSSNNNQQYAVRGSDKELIWSLQCLRWHQASYFLCT